MAAYAALVSLMNNLHSIQIHPQVSAFFYHKQIESLHHIINVLLDFMESSTSHGGSREEEEEVLERSITSTAHSAEDVIESHVVDQLLAGSSNLLDLETEIEDMNSVKETAMVMEFQVKLRFKDEQSSPAMSSASSKPLTTIKKDFVVGFDEKLIQIMDRLTGYQPDLQVVPIVGMGGIGKTTLAKSLYDNLLIVESFDIRAWVTISQEYSVKYVLYELLSCIKDRKINASIGAIEFEMDINSEIDQLGLALYKTLWGRRYLIVLDDLWSVEAWDMIKFYFPNNNDRSRVVITTRISSVATHLSSSSFEMNFLNKDQSWELFCRNVFVEKGCTPELEKIGKRIVRECKGLPLSIVVIGGLLRNSTYWWNIARDLNSILMSVNDAHCLNILSLSYNHLPAHLKPCFLYLGVFQEDEKICVSRLIKFFVAEGFLKPKEGQILEEVAEDYLNDLVDRNLIIVDSWKWNGKIKYCKMHDLVREVCLDICEREKIYHVMKMFEIPAGINKARCVVLNDKVPMKKKWPEGFEALPSASLARTFLSYGGPLPLKFRLLRVLNRVEFESLKDVSEYVNLRYLDWNSNRVVLHSKLPSSVFLLWNVHTLILRERIEAPSEIWYMRQLRHLEFYRIFLPDPPPSDMMEQQGDALLPNLHTLSRLVDFSFTEEVCKRISNIKKLDIVYTDLFGEECQKKHYFYLVHLHKLQSLSCFFDVPKRGAFVQSLVFPSSLRKLSLRNCGLHWEDLNTYGLSLPHLQVLKLYCDAAVGNEWDCVEGAFPRLKFLQMIDVDLMEWTAESSDFPVLEKLHLEHLPSFEQIPSWIGEIQTLRSLHLCWCSVSAADSSMEILEEQLSLGNDDLQVVVESCYNSEEKKSAKEKVERMSFTSKNFKLF